MSDKTQEFSQRMLERALKRQELLSAVITSRILEPLEISTLTEPRAPSEISELSLLSPPSESFDSPAPRESTVPVVSSALTQPSVTESSVPSAPLTLTETSIPLELTESLVSSVPSALTESSLESVSLSKCYVNTVEPSIPTNHRRQRLAELANRVDIWISEGENNAYTKSNDVKNKSSALNIQLKATVENSTSTNKETTRLTTMSSSGLTKINEECYLTKTKTSTNKESTKLINLPSNPTTIKEPNNITQAFGNESISTQQPVHNCNDYVDENEITVNGTPSVAARRAIFEKFTAQPQNTKSVSTTVSISVTKTTSAAVNSPTRSITTVANKSSAVTAIANDTISKFPVRTISEHRTVGSTPPANPPCIKNVLLKKKPFDTLDKVCDDDRVSATSSPRNTSIESPADKIVKSVGRVKCMSPLSTNELYPRIEVVDNDTIPTESENKLSSSKRRNDGSSIITSSTYSLESLSDDESIVAKRRCEFGLVDPYMTAIETESSNPESPSLVSDHDGTFSQTSNSFTFYHSPNYESPQYDVDSKPLAYNGSANSEESQETEVFKEEPKKRPHTHTITQSPLVHTISTYRKQQQQLRLANNKMQTEEQYIQEESQDNNYVDDEEEVRALEITAERVAILENIVQEQNSIISQATQALNISDMYRQKNIVSSQTSEYSNEHLHAERLLLIANLKRTDAVLEVQRLRYEHNLSPACLAGGLRIRPPGNGKRLVIDSLRFPILTAVTSINTFTKNKTDLRARSVTKWPKEIRYFVCVIKATATVYRPPVTKATRPIDAIGEALNRFTLDDRNPYNELGYGYIEFIIKPNKSSGRKCPDAEGAPIIIDGLDDNGWKIMVELYGLFPTESGNSSGDNKENQDKGVLDKLWSSVTPNKEPKRHNFSKIPKIESPGGSSKVRTSMYRQLAYFVFSNNEVDRRQFTLNKVHQSGGSISTTKSAGEPEVGRICMQMLEDGEDYVLRHVQSDLKGSISDSSHQENLVIKPLRMPSECKLTEGFLTLFDDFATRMPFELRPNETPRWQHNLNKNISKALWTRLWVKVQIINDPNAEKEIGKDYTPKKNRDIMYPQTVILKYWLYPEHFEQNREPEGIIDLFGCLPLRKRKSRSEHDKEELLPAAQPFLDSSVRPNSVRLYFNGGYQIKNANDPNGYINEPILLAFDTPDERNEWCNTINGAVNAIAAQHEKFSTIHKFRNKQKQLNHKK